MNLRSAERLQLIELLTLSLNHPDEEINKLWQDESEKRYEALVSGKANSLSINEVIGRYK